MKKKKKKLLHNYNSKMESKHLFTSSPCFSLSLPHTSPDLQALLLSEVLYIRLSDRRTVQESSLAKIPQVDVKLELDGPPTHEEIRKATMQLKVGKSPGINGIPAEVYQHGGEAVLDKLQDLFTNCWEKGTLPQDLRDAVIISLYKNKGEKSDLLFDTAVMFNMQILFRSPLLCDTAVMFNV